MAITLIDSVPVYPVTGAVHHFIAMAGGGPNTGNETIYYLGTCEVQPDIRIWELSAEVKNDVAGRILPGQKTDQGQKADIGLQLSRYSQSAYHTQLLLPAGAADGGPLQIKAGHRGRFSRGALIFGSRTFKMWQVFERQMVAGVRDANMPYGYFWPQVELIQHAPVTLGNQEKQLLLVLEAQPYFVPQATYSTVGTNERSWLLWSEATSDFPASVLVPQ